MMQTSSLPVTLSITDGRIGGFRLAEHIAVSSIEVNQLSPASGTDITVSAGVRLIVDTVSATNYTGGALLPDTALSSLTDVSSSISPSNGQSLVWNGSLWTASTITGGGGGGGGVTDHGALTGLTDNDHPQYVLSATNAYLSAIAEDNVIRITALEGSQVTDHGALTGLTDNDHPQYVLSATNSALSSLVTNIQTSTVNLSAYITTNESSWNNNGVTDHGALTGLTDNDHPQYVLSATNSALSSLVTSIQTSTVDISAYIAANESSWNSGGVTDHGALTGLTDNDHPQYVLSATNSALSSLVSDNQGLFEDHIATVNPHSVSLSSLVGVSISSPTTGGVLWLTGTSYGVSTIPESSVTNLQTRLQKVNGFHEYIGAPVAFTNWTGNSTGTGTRYVCQPRYFTYLFDEESVSWATIETGAGAGPNGYLTYVTGRGRYIYPGKGFHFVIATNNTGSIDRAACGFFGADTNPISSNSRPEAGVYIEIPPAGSNFSAVACNSSVSSTVNLGIVHSDSSAYSFNLTMNSSGGCEIYAPSVSGTTRVGYFDASTCPSTGQERSGSMFYSIYATATTRAYLFLGRLTTYSTDYSDTYWRYIT